MAYDNGLVDSNPCKRVRKEKEGGRRERYLTYLEETRLMEVLTGDLSHLAPAVTTREPVDSIVTSCQVVMIAMENPTTHCLIVFQPWLPS